MKKGFTTVELLAGVTIIAIVVIALYLALILSTRFQAQAKRMTIATVEAQRELENKRNTTFANLAVGTSTSNLTNLPNGQKTVTISSVASNLKRIVVTVTWQVGDIQKTVTLDSYATLRGLNDISQP